MQINILEAKNRLSQLIRSVEEGGEVTIAKRGKPVARLVPAVDNAMGMGKVGEAATILAWLEANPLPACSRRSHEEIEAGIAEERAAWD
ncbi:MAG: type II toxin-antitoxin system prevent-host-death family antitoxin [Rhodanobacter sp.]